MIELPPDIYHSSRVFYAAAQTLGYPLEFTTRDDKDFVRVQEPHQSTLNKIRELSHHSGKAALVYAIAERRIECALALTKRNVNRAKETDSLVEILGPYRLLDLDLENTRDLRFVYSAFLTTYCRYLVIAERDAKQHYKKHFEGISHRGHQQASPETAVSQLSTVMSRIIRENSSLRP